MSLEALLFQVLCILAVFVLVMCLIEHTRNKSPCPVAPGHRPLVTPLQT